MEFVICYLKFENFMIKNFPIVALVGPPNAGKSTLMNKIAGKPLAVTSDLPGTTRDRQYADTAWNGTNFTLVDTAGLDLNAKEGLKADLLRQIEVALGQADVILFVADGKQNKAAIEQTVLKKFRSSQKPVVLAVNKLDSPKTREEKLVEFQKLGIKPMFGISALSGLGLGDLLDAIVKLFPDVGNGFKPFPIDDNSVAIAIVGKPNVGKSSIFNKILDEERVVVSPLPGTTRTAIDSQITIGDVNYTFIDTAGLKKKEYRQTQPDVYSGFQTFKAIRRSDVCFFVIDATEEITKQDQRVASEIFNMQKGCVILANKCDLLDKAQAGRLGKNTKSIAQNQDDKYQTVRDYISHHFPFLWMCPLFFVSALTGSGLTEAIKAIQPIFERRHKTVDNQTLSEFLSKMLKKNPPKLLRDQKHPKVFSLHQTDVNPPRFELLVNHPAAISTQFRKFLENSIIKELDFYGTPIILRLTRKDKG